MSKYYNAQKSRNLYAPHSTEAFKVSRSKIDLFMECERCYYMDARLGTARPPGFPLTLNVAVDGLLKKEFDIHRAKKSAHPMMSQYGIDAIPFEHEKMDEWRENFVGVRHHYKPTNFLVFGAVDDVWVNPQGELIVVDYKATAKATSPSLEGDLGARYQRQMEVYQWLLEKNGFVVSPTGYFVYVNGKKDVEAFDAKLEFDVHVLPCQGQTSWIESVLEKMKKSLDKDSIPSWNEECDHCAYFRTRQAHEAQQKSEGPKKENGALF